MADICNCSPAAGWTGIKLPYGKDLASNAAQKMNRLCSKDLEISQSWMDALKSPFKTENGLLVIPKGADPLSRMVGTVGTDAYLIGVELLFKAYGLEVSLKKVGTNTRGEEQYQITIVGRYNQASGRFEKNKTPKKLTASSPELQILATPWQISSEGDRYMVMPNPKIGNFKLVSRDNLFDALGFAGAVTSLSQNGDWYAINSLSVPVADPEAHANEDFNKRLASMAQAILQIYALGGVKQGPTPIIYHDDQSGKLYLMIPVFTDHDPSPYETGTNNRPTPDNVISGAKDTAGNPAYGFHVTEGSGRIYFNGRSYYRFEIQPNPSTPTGTVAGSY